MFSAPAEQTQRAEAGDKEREGGRERDITDAGERKARVKGPLVSDVGTDALAKLSFRIQV